MHAAVKHPLSWYVCVVLQQVHQGAHKQHAQQAQQGQRGNSSGGSSKLSKNGRPLPSRAPAARIRPGASQHQGPTNSSNLEVQGQRAQLHPRPCRSGDGHMQQQHWQQQQLQDGHNHQQHLSPGAAVFHQAPHDQLLAAYVAAMGSPAASGVNPYFAQHMQHVRNSYDGRTPHHMSNVVIDWNGVLSRQGSGFPTSGR